MSTYLVIARKWRPGLFEEIVGQTHVTRTLKNAVSSGRVAHAYLFSGPRGVGKTTAARILAKSLNCVNGPTPTPCNACESCKGIAGGSSIDVFEIDGASNNGVENIRELTENVRYVPSQGKYKIYIIDEVHMLSTPAFNALLKTLEEPPPHAVFIFATTEVHKIPLTILSRCQRFDFKRIPFRDIQDHLKRIVEGEGIKFDDKALFTIAREADGSLRDAQSLLDQVVAFSGGTVTDAHVTEALGLMDRSIIYELLEAIAARDGKECLNIVEKIYDFGYDLKRACSDLLENIRDLTVVKVTGEAGLLDLPDSELERLKKNAEGIGIERMHLLFSVISRGYEEVSRSAVPRYSFEMALLKAAQFEELSPVTELVARLEGLKGRLNGRETPGAADNKAASARPAQPNPPNPVVYREADRSTAVKVTPSANEATGASAYASSEGNQTVEGFIDHINRRSDVLARALASVEISMEGDIISITAGKDSEVLFRLKKDFLESAGAEYFRRRVRINLKKAEAECPKEKENGGDALIKDAVRILGGRVIEDRRRTNV
jgi:DNA polymerase III subunit gamma/tau